MSRCNREKSKKRVFYLKNIKKTDSIKQKIERKKKREKRKNRDETGKE
jgi:hypothetical protein